MKYKTFLLTACIIGSWGTINAENSIVWETLGNKLDADNQNYFVQRFTIKADEPVDGFAFCQLKMDMTPNDSSDELIEILPGYYYIKSPRFNKLAPGDSILIDVTTKGVFKNHLYLPDGMHLVKGNKAVSANTSRKSIIAFPEQYIDPKTGANYMTYGDKAYAINDSLKSNYRAKPYQQIPTPKSVTLKDKKVAAGDILNGNFKIKSVNDSREDYWKADITGNEVIIETNSAFPEVIAENLKRRIIASAGNDGLVNEAVIEDWSDYPYRGFMLDVARNFLPKEDVMKVIDLMSQYGLNVLHFHVGEDEGWRVEIPSLPELTEVGSHRGFTLTDDVPFLKGIYSGDGNPDSNTVANGFYTVDDFIEIIQHAYKKGVNVIPEFDTPGHSRAAIRAMEWRAKKTGDQSWRLVHDGDTSKYRTAQDFYDNTMNPALEGPYKLWDLVFDDLITIYNKAGVPLMAVNIGGDEVAEHVWDGSEKAQALMKEKGMTQQRELHAYFVEKVAKIAAEKGIKIAGWQEMALDNHPEFDAVVLPVTAAVNSWTFAGPQSRQLAKKGYPVILSNVNYLYFDHHHNGHPEDPGMWWGGIIDEMVPLHATIDTLLPDTTLQSQVKGVSGQIFSETVRDFGMVQRFMFPRLLALAERAHNAKPTISEEEYFGLLTEEMPDWDAQKVQFFVRQPGIIIENEEVLMNEPYGLGEIRYTLDGTEPQRSSKLYNGPFKAGDAKQIRAKQFIGNSASQTSVLYR